MRTNAFLIAARVAFSYAVIAGLWIVFSDTVLFSVARDPATITALQVAKGWFFVAATAVLLFWVIRKNLDSIVRAERDLQERNETLTQTNEELTAAEEELRQQFTEIVASQDKIRRQNECLLMLRETAFSLMHERDVDALLRLIVEKAATLGESSHAYLYTLDDDGQTMELKVVIGTAIREIGFRQRRGEGVVGQVWNSGMPLVIHDYDKWDSRMGDKGFDIIRTSTGFPLIVGGEVAGVFGVNYFDHRELDEHARDLLASFAELASITLANARLNRSLREELTERALMEADLELQRARTQAVLDALPDIILRLSPDGFLLEFKQGGSIESVAPLDDYIGKHLREFTPPYLGEKMTFGIAEAVRTRSVHEFDYEIVAPEGRLLYREMRLVASADDEVIAIVRDITERREMERELKKMSLTDQATGLSNRAFFETELRRLNDGRFLPVGVIVGDIDGLKFINDTLGHDTGDKLIVTAAEMIAGCFGDGDVVARIGGGEFGVIMANSDAAAVKKACDRIQQAVAAYRESTRTPLSISLGRALRFCVDETLADTFKTADRNMYREKLHSKQSGHSAIVATLAQALEARDFVTDGHADRLQELMERLAVAVGLPNSELPDLRLLGRFHDIGKVGIPDHILFKPGRLTAEEFEVMKRHSEIGYRIALASPELEPIADWILKHQEWWNGEGYPLGLAGEDIPLPCRILGIVDAYDAMTNDRPYRKAMTHTDAVSELVRCAGRQFDASLVALFVKLLQPN
ncbi:MAG: diguanylate cyclase [Sporomusaceae bacterium]|nr:diguanylate cyclase [Sporomusaceae bacterium]